MSARISPISLTARLIDRYLMIGLACLLACVVLSIMLAWHGALTQLVSATALAPLGLLLIGGYFLKRTVRLNAAIEAQLAQITSANMPLESVLRPLNESDHPAAAGWNHLLVRLNENASMSELDVRLSAALDNLQGKKWECLLNALPDGLAITNAGRRVSWSNSALLSILQTPAGQSLGARSIDEILAACAGSKSQEALARLTQTKGTLVCELHRGAELADGVLRVCRIPLVEEPFEAGSKLWVVRDITQHKLAEEMRNQFVFTATHELRTPLANIKAYAETLSMQDDIDVESQKGFYNIINAEATRLARFVDDLLNVSQMEAGALTVARNELDLERMLSEVIQHVRPQAEQKKLNLQTQFPPKFPQLHADKDKLAAALVNLVGNAVKYTPDGGQVRVLVEVESSEIHFHIEDTGIGISPEELPRLCDRFFRSQDERVQNITGSGLGLAFSQEVARLHGGRITVQSELNKGSRFTMTVPIA